MEEIQQAGDRQSDRQADRQEVRSDSDRQTDRQMTVSTVALSRIGKGLVCVKGDLKTFFVCGF